jgi:hypothetical protein
MTRLLAELWAAVQSVASRSLSTRYSAIRRSERPGLPRRSPAEPRGSRLFCTRSPGLGVHRRRLRTGLGHGLTVARLEPSVKTGCCREPFRLAAEGARRRLSGIPLGHPCGNLHRAGFTGRPLAGVPSDLRCSGMRFRVRAVNGPRRPGAVLTGAASSPCRGVPNR